VDRPGDHRPGRASGDAEPFAEAALTIAERFPTGTVLERSLDHFTARLPDSTEAVAARGRLLADGAGA
jgi:hypothetical protein